MLTNLVSTEGVQGGQAGVGMNTMTRVLSLRNLAVVSRWQGRIVLGGASTWAEGARDGSSDSET